jgi:hypothetical protein
MTQDDYALLKQLGLEKVDQAENRNCYVAVIDQGQVLYEKLSKKSFQHQTTIHEQEVILSTSAYAADDVQTGIVVDDTAYNTGKRGLSFLVWDNEAEMPICNVWFANRDLAKESALLYLFCAVLVSL